MKVKKQLLKVVTIMMAVLLVLPAASVNAQAKTKKVLYTSAKKNISLTAGSKKKVSIIWKNKGKLTVKSSNKKVSTATVSKKGTRRSLIIKAIKPGKSTITITGKGTSQRIRFNVSVKKIVPTNNKPLPDEKTNKASLSTASSTIITLNKGESIPVSVSYNGNSIVNATSLSSSIADVSTGERIGNTIALTISAKSKGYTTIKVSADDSEDTLYFYITVNGDPVHLSSPSEKRITLTEGESQDVTINYTGDGSLYYDSSSPYTASGMWNQNWNNNQETFTIYGNHTGSATITITGSGTTDSVVFYITVKEPDYKDNVRISIPSLPLTVSNEYYSESANITDITYSVSKGYSGYKAVIKISGTKTYGSDSSYLSIGYKIMSGTKKVDSGSIFEKVDVGQSFEVEDTIYDIDEGDYSIVFDNVGDHTSLKDKVKISLPSVPADLYEYGFRGSIIQEFSVSDISYDVEKSFSGSGYNITVSVSGSKSYDTNGSGQTRAIHIGWKLYEGNGNTVIDDGTGYVTGIATGESFKNQTFKIYNVPEGTYRLTLISTN